MTQEELKEFLDYCPLTGHFKWKVRAVAQRPIGSIAGNINTKIGYVQIRLQGVLYYAHRLAFLYMTGAFPEKEVDHINGNRTDNRWTNLRQATSLEQSRNCALSKNNTSGIKGVCWDKRKQKWYARITINRRDHFVGYFDDLNEAAKARKQAEQSFGFHPNHGRPIL